MAQGVRGFVVFVSILVSAVLARGQEPLLLDVAGTADLIYPFGPRVTVTNTSGLKNLELWVIRMLDGGVVRKYSIGGSRLWKQVLDLSPSGKAGPPVEDRGSGVPFVLFLVGPNQEVAARHIFTVGLTPGRVTPTSPVVSGVALHYFSFGKVGTVANDEVQLVPSDYEEPIKLTLNKHSKVFISDSKADYNAWLAPGDWDNVKAKFVGSAKRGDMLSAIYFEGEDGKKIVREISYVPATSFPWRGFPPSADLFAGLRVQIGIVGSVKNGDSSQTSAPHEVILKMRSLARRWRIPASTAINRGGLVGSPKDLAPGALLAVGAVELKGNDVQAAQILLLKDLTTP